jgi:hypothetical protein
MEPTLVQHQDMQRYEANPATGWFTALAMPVLNAVANSVVAEPVVAALGFDALIVGQAGKEAAHIDRQNYDFSTLSFNYVKAATASTSDPLQLAA